MKKNMKMSSIIGKFLQHSMDLGRKIFKNLGKDNIWKRMFKNILATMILGLHAPLPFAHSPLMYSILQ